MKSHLLHLVFALLLWATGLQAQTYDEWVERAVQATECDSLAQAEACLRAALKQEPANPRNLLLFNNLGTLLRKQQRPEEALEAYSFALNFAPYNVPVLLNRASLYWETGKDELARVDYSLVLDVEQDNEEALLMRAYIYRQQRAYQFAKADYARLLRLQPSHYQARLGLAILEQKMGNHADALTLLDALLADFGEVPERAVLLYQARAEVEWERQHLEQALMDIDRAIALDATGADAYLMRGRIYLQQGKKPLAKRDFLKAVALGAPAAEVKPLLQQCK